MAAPNVDDIYASKLVERVVHDITEAEGTATWRLDPRAIIGSLADVADVVAQVTETAMAARERDPLRLHHGGVESLQ